MQCTVVCLEGAEGSDRVARQHTVSPVLAAPAGGAAQQEEELVSLCEPPGKFLVLLQLIIRLLFVIEEALSVFLLFGFGK